MEQIVAFLKANQVAVVAGVIVFLMANLWVKSSESVIPFLVGVGAFFAVKFALGALNKSR